MLRLPCSSLAILALAVVLNGCASAVALPVRLPPPVISTTIGADDIFEVKIYEDPTLDRTYRVAPNGTIDFPLVGRIEVDGQEPQELAELIAARLKEHGILRSPSVSVSMKEINSKKVSISGQVAKPGQYPIVPGTSVVDLITLAGGFTITADRDRVTLKRHVSKEKTVRVVFSAQAIIEGRIGDVPLQSGDSLYVEERAF
ncbi:MAG: polysaccharide biosynthesis/export family protein [Polyangiales bacterium]